MLEIWPNNNSFDDFCLKLDVQIKKYIVIISGLTECFSISSFL